MQLEKKTFLQQLAQMFGFKAEITENEVEAAAVSDDKAVEPAIEAKEEAKSDKKAEMEAFVNPSGNKIYFTAYDSRDVKNKM